MVFILRNPRFLFSLRIAVLRGWYVTINSSEVDHARWQLCIPGFPLGNGQLIFGRDLVQYPGFPHITDLRMLRTGSEPGCTQQGFL